MCVEHSLQLVVDLLGKLDLRQRTAASAPRDDLFTDDDVRGATDSTAEGRHGEDGHFRNDRLTDELV